MTFEDMTDEELREAYDSYQRLYEAGDEDADWYECMCDVQMEMDRRAGL